MQSSRLPSAAFAAALTLALGYVAASGFQGKGISGLFPAVVGGVGLVAATVNLIQVLRGAEEAVEDTGSSDADARWMAGLSFGVPVAYAAMLWLLGFWVASAVVMLALPWMLGYRKKLVVLTVALGTLVAIELVFVQVFDMRLPRGLVVERWLDAQED